MKKKQVLKLAITLSEIIFAVIQREVVNSQLGKETRKIHSNIGVDAFEKTQEVG